MIEYVKLPSDATVEVDFRTADEVFIKQMSVKYAGTLLPQHSHKYDHTTLVAAGSVEIWVDGESIGTFAAPHPVLIAKGTKHLFKTLEDNTVLYCIHNLTHGPVVEVLEEHQIIGDV